MSESDNYWAIAERYWDMPEDERDELAERLAIYFCAECDEEHSHDFKACPRYPKMHDESGYMGTGTDFEAGLRRLATMIAEDVGPSESPKPRPR